MIEQPPSQDSIADGLTNEVISDNELTLSAERETALSPYDYKEVVKNAAAKANRATTREDEKDLMMGLIISKISEKIGDPTFDAERMRGTIARIRMKRRAGLRPIARP